MSNSQSQTKFKTNYNQYSKPKTDFSNVKSPVQPQFAEESDINNIMQKYARTGVLPNSNRQALYLDLTESNDFTAMQDKVLKMNQLFQELPAEVRSTFGNPETFYNAFSSDVGRVQLQALGVLPKSVQAVPAQPGAGSGAQAPASSELTEKTVST